MGFAMDLKKFADKAKGNADLITRKIVIDLAHDIDSRSPVGDPSRWNKEFHQTMLSLGWTHKGYAGGRFRGNWQLGIATRPQGMVDAVDPSGAETVARITASVPTQAAGKVYFLTNNLPYAMRLENGYSGQAPQGIVGLAVVKFQGIVADSCATVNK